MTRVAVIAANLGAYDRQGAWPALTVPQGVVVDVHRFDDTTLPPRPLAMTSRLRCGIPKMFGWQMRPGYQAYIWIDASCAPTPIAVEWFLTQLGQAELAVFRHPDRRTIREEYEFLKARLAKPGERYLTSRYTGEWLDELYAWICNDDAFIDGALFASTAFVYRPTARVTAMLKEWWITKTRWHLHDQIAWPYLIVKSGCRVNVIPDNYLRCPALTYTRNHGRRAA